MHHTKFKGDVALGKIVSDLILKGYVPCIPLSNHKPYDLVVVANDGQTFKLQVKYSFLKKNGTVEVRFRTSWSNKNGIHIKHYSKNDFDYYAIYCPEKETVIYIPNDSDCPKVVRFDKPSNNQSKLIKWANDYLNLK